MNLVSKIAAVGGVGTLLMASAATAQEKIDYDWKGAYVGGFIAGSFFDVELSDITDTFTNDSPAINELVLAGGINGGYNWMPRNENLLLGLELEIQGGHFSENIVRFNAEGTDGQLYENRINSMTSLKGRVGMISDNLLVYISGGPTWAQVDYVAIALDEENGDQCTTVGIICAESSEELLGLTVGVGMEYAIRKATTLRFEITQISLPTASATILNGGETDVCSFASADDCTGFFSSSSTQIQFGVNFSF